MTSGSGYHVPRDRLQKMLGDHLNRNIEVFPIVATSLFQAKQFLYDGTSSEDGCQPNGASPTYYTIFLSLPFFSMLVERPNTRKKQGWLDSATANQDDHDRRTSFPFSPLHNEALAEESRYPEPFYMDCRCGGGNISARGSEEGSEGHRERTYKRRQLSHIRGCSVQISNEIPLGILGGRERTPCRQATNSCLKDNFLRLPIPSCLTSCSHPTATGIPKDSFSFGRKQHGDNLPGYSWDNILGGIACMTVERGTVEVRAVHKFTVIDNPQPEGQTGQTRLDGSSARELIDTKKNDTPAAFLRDRAHDTRVLVLNWYQRGLLARYIPYDQPSQIMRVETKVYLALGRVPVLWVYCYEGDEVRR
ncbi:hypothetical protein ARMSODRAFT_980407 [Armillaria solidipes]|uniref:Uncharacterized protein n=1 Tax=Armillaria solidipes TaxID=1076256 RepID=A0A2H3B1I1_9AGAR|nr:hypothetical protein ARMSODRAFT_980407 [Armillaria solidipes]